MKNKPKSNANVPKHTLYIDESGNTGEILKLHHEQPFFVLGAVVLNKKQLGELEELENQFRQSGSIQPTLLELKSKSTYDNFEFTKTIIEYISENCIFAVEVTEKRHYLACTINSHSVIPQFIPAQNSISPESAKVFHISAANEIYEIVSDSFLERYVDCCRIHDGNVLYELLRELHDSIIRRNKIPEIAGLIEYIISMTFDPNLENKEKRLNFLFPEPDILPNGRIVWFVPYITSFTNIYARLNFTCNRAKLIMIHDEQKQFKELIGFYKTQAEKHGQKIPRKYQIMGYGDFVFNKENSLIFENSKNYKGLQWADILTGFVNRATISYLQGSLSQERIALLKKILTARNVPAINFVCRRDFANEIDLI